MKVIHVFFFLLILVPLSSFAQQKDSIKFNQLDKQGLKDGMWYLHIPARMGDDAYNEFGSFVHGQKWGKWYRFTGEGDMIAEENFRNNVLDGEVKYFEN